MAKIIFNNKEYFLNDSALSDATNSLKAHLSSSMNGNGATINLDGVSYSIDSTKLSNATSAFTTHLGAIAGNGSRVVVGGVEYSIDSNKVAGAVSDLEVVLGNLNVGGGGDEPTTTLAAGLYETGTENLITSWEDLLANGVVHVDNGVVTTNADMNTQTNDSSNILVGDLILPNDGSITSLGTIAFGICENLTSIVIPNSVTSFEMGAFIACFSLTSVEIPDSVTNLGAATFQECGSLISVEIPNNVTSIEAYTFHNCTSLPNIKIPESVTSIGENAFCSCSNLTNINYTGTKSQWKAISCGENWNYNTGNYIITCTDGTIAKDGTEN